MQVRHWLWHWANRRFGGSRGFQLGSLTALTRAGPVVNAFTVLPMSVDWPLLLAFQSLLASDNSLQRSKQSFCGRVRMWRFTIHIHHRHLIRSTEFGNAHSGWPPASVVPLSVLPRHVFCFNESTFGNGDPPANPGLRMPRWSSSALKVIELSMMIGFRLFSPRFDILRRFPIHGTETVQLILSLKKIVCSDCTSYRRINC